MTKIKQRSNCPISYALDIFGDKWSLLIIRDIMFKEKRTYSDFLNSEEKIATNILADRLTMLECAGLIKTVISEERRRGHYILTEKGLDLVPVMLELVRWSAKYDKNTGAPPEFVEKIKKNGESFIQEVKKGLKKK